MTNAPRAFVPLLLVTACASQPPAIEVRNAWARATAPGQTSGAIYATIVNTGGADRLNGATSDRARTALLHSNRTEDGVAKMRMLAEVAIPAGANVALSPGATHIMIDGLTAPLIAGKTVAVTLRFAEAGPRSVTAIITAPGVR